MQTEKQIYTLNQLRKCMVLRSGSYPTLNRIRMMIMDRTIPSHVIVNRDTFLIQDLVDYWSELEEAHQKYLTFRKHKVAMYGVREFIEGDEDYIEKKEQK